MTVEQQGGHGGVAGMTPRPTGPGVTGAGGDVGRQAVAALDASSGLATQASMEVIAERSHLDLAYGRMTANGGAPGVDGMTVDDLKEWCRAHGAGLIGQLLVKMGRPARLGLATILLHPSGLLGRGCGFAYHQARGDAGQGRPVGMMVRMDDARLAIQQLQQMAGQIQV